MIAAAIARRWRFGVPAGLCARCGKDTDGSGQRDDDGDLMCPDCIDAWGGLQGEAPVALGGATRRGSEWDNVT